MKISFTNVFKLACTFALSLCMTGAFAQAILTVNNSSAAGDYQDLGVTVDWGHAIGVITGDLVIVDDDVAANSETDACEPLANGAAVAGNIALVDRGSCYFADKAVNAENAGAIAVIICNINPNEIINMSAPAGIDTDSIPAIMISLELCNDIRAAMANETVNVTMTDAFNVLGSSVAYATQTPKDQILPLSNIQAAFQNRGSEVQYGLEIKCDITDPMGTVTTLALPAEETDSLPPGSWIATFPDAYTPAMVGEYTARFYNNGATTTNYLDGVDEETTKFYITDDVFTHDDGSGNSRRLSAGAGRFAMGSIFPIVSSADALSATFAIAEPDSIPGEIVTLAVYKLDTNGDGNIDEDGSYAFEDVDLGDILGFASHEVVGGSAQHSEITVDIADFNGGGVLRLEGTAENPGLYMLVIEYIDNNTLYLSSPNDIQNAPIAPITVQDDDGNDVSGFVGNTFVRDASQWFTGGFNGGPQAILRLNVSPAVGVNEPELEEGSVSVMPNPASELVSVALDFAELASTVEVSLLDITGRTLSTEIYNNVQQETVTMNVSDYASGTYFINVRTEEGRKTLRLVVK